MSRLEAALRRAQAEHEQPTMPPVRQAIEAAGHRRQRDAAADRLNRALTSLTAPLPNGGDASAPVALGHTGSGAEKLVVTDRPEQSTVEQYRKLAQGLLDQRASAVA